MNETKTKAIVFSAKRDKPVHPPLILNSNIIGDVTVHEHLDLTLSSNYLGERISPKNRYVRSDRHKKSFLFPSIKWWNSLTLEIRISSSLDIFKHSLLKYLQFPSRHYLFLYSGSISVNISYSLET